MSSNEDSRSKTKRQCISCLKKFLAFFFSTVGSCCSLVCYTTFGGFLFVYLESENERHVRNDMRSNKDKVVETLWNLTKEMNILHERNWSRMAEMVLKNFTEEVYKNSKMKGWDGSDASTDDVLQWDFAGSLLYSITVVTTIGYGHITPKTAWGQLATIFYAILGIPLTLYTITNLGSIMAAAFRFIYGYIIYNKSNMFIPAKKRDNGKDRNLINRILSCLQRHNKHIDNKSSMKDSASSAPQTTMKNKLKSRTFFLKPIPSTSTSQDINKIRVPICVSLVLMLAYLALGSLIFRASEDWSTLVCLYFCFITLSTIGFGDYVPGVKLDEPGSKKFMIVCAVYLLFGLALIAMCFDLIQEEVCRLEISF
ncbi:hypothetical protein HELRODRAFT_72133 [Helobdella robusta]|uniref:Potassium channel domain-containing protein n=1 Tax=Helobdella robusta TaxID=6412 RepID=T1G0W3_HELRO|nr:hypothetical protein HELRODRAFT_72133 [Helobdella robusta]ESO10860.1 hypothetical protein HELRODRAFT_72133 [Helobdella robusta]